MLELSACSCEECIYEHINKDCERIVFKCKTNKITIKTRNKQLTSEGNEDAVVLINGLFKNG